MNRQYIKITITVVFAAVLWYVIFVVKPMNFWLSMCCGILLLLLAAGLSDRTIFKIGPFKLKYAVLGIISAAVLYAIFYIGNDLSSLILPMKDSQIANVYMNRNGTSIYVISALLLLIIGPGEAIFWNGFVQKALMEKHGIKSVVIAAALYTVVHIVTLNFMLILAALVCGLFWGALYFRTRNLYPVIISHALWDMTVFVLLPFQR
ncbi:hypothetical protein SAMN02745823_02084 [Sporobacter termitidis DSM 10068]|uniref:CAAX prenyl protease 2/Lysostaphin resistance protein A-like domain-containing protein n=1 Tax=Sporobacter termitidis DSM 10068 TaxID=1123282 RepID=A0A1M5XVW0_9FIRM|nr:CPBP family intramembrane glutamic endopeptidase [Sporobacter termitidis]SHI03930.1 hypothetical protein SAMN02745823_02084 [Sporobacter termitidis DSM 10068]